MNKKNDFSHSLTIVVVIWQIRNIFLFFPISLSLWTKILTLWVTHLHSLANWNFCQQSFYLLRKVVQIQIEPLWFSMWLYHNLYSTRWLISPKGGTTNFCSERSKMLIARIGIFGRCLVKVPYILTCAYLQQAINHTVPWLICRTCAEALGVRLTTYFPLRATLRKKESQNDSSSRAVWSSVTHRVGIYFKLSLEWEWL